jgi:hypothetical protein
MVITPGVVGCEQPTDPPPDARVDPAQNPPARTTWVLGHRVVESDGIRIVGKRIGHYDEATSVSLGRDADGFEIGCHVSVSVPGRGGPDTMVGEKVPATVQGRRGFRSGKGAEGDYVMWQIPDESWVLTSCDRPEQRRFVDVVAAAVQLRTSTLRLPFQSDPLPRGYGISSAFQEDLDDGSSGVYLGRIRPRFGHAEVDIEISYRTGERRHQPTGRDITVNGRPAMLDEEPRSPGVCVLVQQRYVCVRSATSDTGPYPDRSEEIPLLISLAEGLTFARDLDDQSTWFAADRAFG